ncbi:IS110 family RNA-guided transposase [Vallitalea okinawensis]|uniref:IS110 family transposase n=1 Tax=Vallitalea okinawensis TaxID=2078660 RepID=UPI000CFB8385|nr:IS110 family transposase [Vallitalea okinawensis]
MYFVGIDISKYKHDCFITTETGDIVCNSFTIMNNHDGFEELLSVLSSLNPKEQIRIGFESTGHYALNLKLFLEKAHYSFMEFNPVLLAKFNKSQSLRRTKTDTIDSVSIARWLMTVEYKPHPVGFYHTYSLKSLTRLRNSLVKQRSFYIIKITNVLDHIFPEFKPFFNNRFSKTALYLLENYRTAEKMARMNSQSYDNLRRISRGKFSMQKFLKLKELARNTVGSDNELFVSQLNSLMTLYKQAAHEVNSLETQIISLIEEIKPKSLTIPGIGSLSVAVIYAEYGDLSKFSSPSQMLSFAGLEPSYYQSGTFEHGGHMVKRGSSHLRYTLMNLCIPLIQHNMVFAEYYAKKRTEGKTHRVACSHLIKKLIRVIFTLEKNGIDFDPTKLR